jgi:hypothetical protein
MANCWAQELGSCSDKITREHLVSRSLFMSDDVLVDGFPWCKDKPIKIGLSSLTAKVLCAKHNSDLSDIDTAGAEAFAVLREATGLSNFRSSFPKKRWTIKRSRIDGRGLERWFLKTLINMSFERDFRIGSDSAAVGVPSRRLVEIAFGLGAFAPGAGLYSVVHVGQQLQSNDTVSFAPLIQNGSFIRGGLFAFRGLRYFLSLEPERWTQLPKGVTISGEDWSISQLNFHNREMRIENGKYLSQVIEMAW